MKNENESKIYFLGRKHNSAPVCFAGTQAGFIEWASRNAPDNWGDVATVDDALEVARHDLSDARLLHDPEDLLSVALSEADPLRVAARLLLKEAFGGTLPPDGFLQLIKEYDAEQILDWTNEAIRAGF